MNFKNLFTILLIALGAVIFIQCGEPADESKTTVEEDTEKISDQFKSERDQMVADFRELQDDIDYHLNEMALRMESAGKEIGEGFEDAYLEMTEDRSELEQAINEIQNATEENWEEVKSEGENIYSEVSSKLSEWKESVEDFF